MEISFKLCLPRDEASVPIVRHIARGALSDLGVTEDCSSDIEIAVAEACTNVLKHAASSHEYEVGVEINNENCEIRVVDAGSGFDHATLAEAASDDEGGRGILLMRALVDRINFTSEPESGTVVHLVKRLELSEDSILKRLAAASAPYTRA